MARGAYREKCPQWVYDMRDQTDELDGLIQESEPFCDEGMMPSSIVLRSHKKGEFVTHVKIYPKDGVKPHYAWGHYHYDIAEAANEYEDRCKQYETKSHFK